MGKYSLPQIQKIVLDNPNKGLIDKGRQMNSKLMMHLYGKDVKSFMKRDEYFENTDIFKSRQEKPVSNKDMWARILSEESLIFAARGGSSRFNLPAKDEDAFNVILSDVRYNISLRKWIQNFALPAYRSDPMGVIFIEIEQLLELDGQAINAPKCYPTYKSIQSVYDYLLNGRNLEYVCFQLAVKELSQYGINDTAVVSGPTPQNQQTHTALSPYFRFVDDEKDIIVKKDNATVMIATEPVMTQPNPVRNDRFGGQVPAFIVSDLIEFTDPSCFVSPISFLVEIADDFLYDRSIRNLQKKLHGFAKAIEPILKCSTCAGTGLTRGTACPDCTVEGQSTGTGMKLKTKVSDVARFPLSVFTDGSGFDYKKIFGYASPPIETWDKQDLNLQQTEQLIYFSYWGCAQNTTTSGPTMKDKNVQDKETATKTNANLKPKYARLNSTADWAQKTENDIANLMGRFWLDTSWKGSNINYSRNYILESPDDLINQYYDGQAKKAPDFILDDMMLRYLNCLYQDNPAQLAKYTKLFFVDPFPHDTPELVEASPVISDIEKSMKRYFSEWQDTKKDMEIITTPLETLKADLKTFAESKQATVTPPETVPAK